jgi:hypothetical protein
MLRQELRGPFLLRPAEAALRLRCELDIVTHPKIYKPPTPVADALIQIDRWLESPTLVLLYEGDGFWETLRPLVDHSMVQGGAVHDARIAALCLRHGVKRLLSADRDFSRFPELRTGNPLRHS